MRTSPVHYIAPSAISITPNANQSPRDLAVHVARGAKIKVCYQPIAELGYNDANYKEWTLRGRNRRLAQSGVPYTIYARLNKTDQTDGYLVFAQKIHDEETDEWSDPYILSPNTSATSAVRLEGADGGKYLWGAIPEKQTANGRSSYWWIRLGSVSAPNDEGLCTVDLDTGILGTDQYNMEWYLDPDKMPQRPVRVIYVERGDWTEEPTVIYTGDTGAMAPDGTLDTDVADALGWTGFDVLSFTSGQEISEPYHCRRLTRNRWLTHRLAEYNAGYTDAELYEKLTTPSRGWEEENWLEVSRVWHEGRLWECQVEGSTDEPGGDGDGWRLMLQSGRDGSGVEFIYYLGTTDHATGQTPAPSTPASSGNGKVDGKVTPYSPDIDDWVPDGWTDNPQGIDYDHQIEWVSQRTSHPVSTGTVETAHEWSGFSTPQVWSKWGLNGMDGDGVEYVYMRTTKNVAPKISTSQTGYENDEFLPTISNQSDCGAESDKTTDDPKGTSRDWPYEWVAKRTMGAPDAETGKRTWEKYSGTMAKWSTYTTLRLDIDNEMDTVPTDSTGKITAARTVETVVHLYDGPSEVDISAATVTVSGAPASTIAAQAASASGKGKKLSWTFIKDKTMDDAYNIAISYAYNGLTYTATFTVTASKGQAVYQLKPSQSSIIFSRNSDNTLTPVNNTLTLDIVTLDMDSTAAMAATSANLTTLGLTVRYSKSAMPGSKTAGTAWPTGNSLTAASTDAEIYIALFDAASGTLLDRETVPVVKDGENGKSITKTSETYRYATNNTGTRPAASSSDWKTTKPTLQQGYWLYTETTITWSDNSTTVLYTDERNPNDGVAGQDIIVDGSTEMKYYVGDSNTTHPAESSSDWKDLSQITQTQGKWLWSKATTYYRKASSAAGSHDGGKSVNYNVSYIAKDGAAGRAVTGITEYYKATNSSAEMPVPTSDTGWSTNPNVSNWGANAKYLWNYEKVTYSSGTTVERTKPQIVAIWTKDGSDGANGRGIDSITNYYKITSSSTPPSKPSTDGGDGWDDDPTAPGAGEYLWNYEKVTYTDGTVFRSDVQLIGHVGANGTDGKDGANGKDGADGKDGANGKDGKDGTDGYGVALVLFRNIYSEEQWNAWAVVGQSDNYSKREELADDDFLKCRVGDFFITTGTATNSGKRHTATWQCTAVTAEHIWGTCVSHVADGDSGGGTPGHVGRWYYYAGDWAPGHTYTMQNTQAPFVKYGSSFYMFDNGGTEPSSLPFAIETDTPPSSDSRWTLMQSTMQYYIAQAYFGPYAHFGSFIINGDWLISQHGTVNGESNDDYRKFDPAYPNTSVYGTHTVNGESWYGYNFIPNFAVDGNTGKTYQNDAYVKGYINATGGFIGNLAISSEGNSTYLRNGQLILNNGETSEQSLKVYGGASFASGLISLGLSDHGLVSDTYYNQNGKAKAISNSTPVWITNVDITLPAWCPVGTMVFVVPLASITVRLANSNERILAGSGETVTSSEIGKAHAIYIKTDPITVGGISRNYWVEWFSA